MATESAALLVHCQHALQITQKELGAIVGKDRRTIQRWQDKGCILLPHEAEALANAVRPVRPDLAEQVLALGREGAERAGMALPATAEEIEAIVEAAAGGAGGVSAAAIRRAVLAAFGKAMELGLHPAAVVAGMKG